MRAIPQVRGWLAVLVLVAACVDAPGPGPSGTSRAAVSAAPEPLADTTPALAAMNSACQPTICQGAARNASKRAATPCGSAPGSPYSAVSTA